MSCSELKKIHLLLTDGYQLQIDQAYKNSFVMI
jgi:hypothetical protein